MKKVLILSLLFAGFFSSCSQNDSSIVYVQNLKLYGQFEMAVELDGKLQQFSKSRERELDSLETVLQRMTVEFGQMKEIPAESYQTYNDLRNSYAFKQKNFEEELLGKSQEYDQQIWERLNSYVQDYASNHDYDYVLGANGNGNLMYAKDTLDITDELVEYCNNQYNGVK